MTEDSNRIGIAQSVFTAFAAGDRDLIEELFTGDFTFHSPPDPELDRDGYFEKCWPGAGSLADFDFVRSIESGDEVVITYEATKPDGSRFRNTEVLTFEGERILKVEVYFGWDL